MFRKIFLFVFLLSTTLCTLAQNPLTIDDVLGRTPQKGSLELIVEPKINMLLERYKKENMSNPSIEGYRVQLYFGSREKATDVKTEFLKNYPTVKSYISYLAPNFRVRVGNFRTQMAAEAFLVRAKKQFPSAYVVTDKIDLPDLD